MHSDPILLISLHSCKRVTSRKKLVQVPVVGLLAVGQGHRAAGPNHVGRVPVESRLRVVDHSRVCVGSLLSLPPAVICSGEAKTDSDDDNGEDRDDGGGHAPRSLRPIALGPRDCVWDNVFLFCSLRCCSQPSSINHGCCGRPCGSCRRSCCCCWN